MKISIALILILSIFTFTLRADDDDNVPDYKGQPIIGIISTPPSGGPQNNSYIKVNYLDFIEAGGGLVVPIPWDIAEDKFDFLIRHVNGILLTGGGADLWDIDPLTGKKILNEYTLRVKRMVDYAMKENKQGRYYPVYGICQGLEEVAMSLTGDPNVLDYYEPYQKEWTPVHFTGEATTRSRFYSLYDEHLFEYLSNNSAFYYGHEHGLNFSIQVNYPLQFGPDKFIITSWGYANGVQFIGSLENLIYPIYLVQYHAEKALWEHYKNNTPHAPEVIEGATRLAQFFVSETKHNRNKFPGTPNDDDIVEDFLIQNWDSNLTHTIYGEYYNFTATSLDKVWKERQLSYYKGGHGFGFYLFIFVIILLIGFGLYKCYMNYKNRQEEEQSALGNDDKQQDNEDNYHELQDLEESRNEKEK